MNAVEINEFFFKFYKLDRLDHSYNPYLRISKPTDSKMQFYKKPIIGTVLYRTSIVKLYLPLILLLRLFLNSAYNLIVFMLYRKPKVELSKVDFVFVSHLTSRNLKSQEDSFYGGLPEKLKKEGKKVGIIYSNQSRSLSKSLIKKIEVSNKYLVPKYLHFDELINFYIEAFKSIKYTLIEARKYSKSGADLDILISKACLSFLRLETMKNYHLIHESVTTLAKYKPKHVFLTLEGHIYENAIYLNCEKQPFINKIFMFQNSPIVSSQIGVFDFVKSYQNKLTYLVQGLAYQSLILCLRDGADVIIIGTKNKVPNVEKVKKVWPLEKIILIPDGDKANIKHVMNLSKSKFKDISSDVTISFHPDTPIGLLNMIRLIRFKRLGFITMSTSNLSLNDLVQYSIVVYTSSSLSVDSLLLGKKLIHVNWSIYNVDPLWLLHDKRLKSYKVNHELLEVHSYPISEYWSLRSELNYEPLFDLVLLP